MYCPDCTAVYRLQDTIEKQVLSTQPSPPRMRFGTGKRPSMAVKTDAPGPGAYKMRPAIGGPPTRAGGSGGGLPWPS